MSRKCEISGKGRQRNHKVSHSNNKVLQVSEANLHKKKVFDSTSGKWVKLKVSSRILRTIDKKGLAATLKDFGLSIQTLA